jgi:hypothetical protein
MFDKHREHKAEEADREAALLWQQQRDGYALLVHLAETFDGVGATDLVLSPSETVFYKVTGAALVEPRRGAGTYTGHSAGISIPVGSLGGHSVRYRVGANKGHYVAGAPVATAIDTGTVHITNRRVVFQGASQTRECAYVKLIGFQHDSAEGTTVLSVSNRQRPTTIHYGPRLSADFEFRLDLALAHFHGAVDQLLASLRHELTEIDGRRPVTSTA